MWLCACLEEGKEVLNDFLEGLHIEIFNRTLQFFLISIAFDIVVTLYALSFGYIEYETNKLLVKLFLVSPFVFVGVRTMHLYGSMMLFKIFRDIMVSKFPKKFLLLSSVILFLVTIRFLIIYPLSWWNILL